MRNQGNRRFSKVRVFKVSEKFDPHLLQLTIGDAVDATNQAFTSEPSTLLHQSRRPLAGPFKRLSETTKFLRTQFRKHSLHLPGVISKGRFNEGLAARSEGDHPQAPVFGALDPAETASAIARYLAGVIFLVFGLKAFMNFIPLPPPGGLAG